MGEKPKLLEGEDNTIDWGAFDLQETKQKTQSTGTIDDTLDTPVKLKNIPAPVDLMANAPDRPKMTQYLTNYQAAKISKQEYLNQLKAYAGAQTLILKDQLEKTMTAHAALTEASLQGVHEQVRVWAQEITAVTDLSLQSTFARSVEKSMKIAQEAMDRMARIKNPHPLIQQQGMKAIMTNLDKTINNIQTGGAEFKDNRFNWRNTGE